MCGFAAIIGLSGRPADVRATDQMARVLAHRGPDEEGRYRGESVAFAFRRLSILDLSPAGHQPMVDAERRVALVFNGEIYNYVELRHELIARGHVFRSTGDSEVLLRSYLEWGTACVERFNGMWAFLIHDEARHKVFGSRDRFGVKPFYRYHCGDAVLFASEIKAIRASGYYHGGPNWTRTSELLLQGRLEYLDDDSRTFFADIEQVPAGSAFELDLDGRMREWKYWSLPENPVEPTIDPTTAFAELFEDAVRLRMRSDVPVGVSLSGGLDSTAIICSVARLKREASHSVAPMPPQAFSFLSSEFDERAYIDETVKYAGADLHSVDGDATRLWETMDDVLWYHDEPLHSPTVLVGYSVFALAARHGVKVVLGGQGADETIGGYSSYFADLWTTLLRRGRVGELWRDISAHSVMHGGAPGARLRKTCEKLLREQFGRSALYRRAAAARRRDALASRGWLTGDLLDAAPTPVRERERGDLQSILRRATTRTPLPLYLRVEDRNSMAHSIEARLPFMDYRLVEFAFRLPASWRLRHGWNKYILREALRGRIPEVVRSRVDKMGFPTPTAQWLRTTWYQPMQDLLASASVKTRGLYHVDVIRRDLARHRRGEIDVSNELFNVAQMERWLGGLDASRPTRATPAQGLPRREAAADARVR
jgi:asparagine synthase (glutamine-hydrolysing)